MKPSFIPGPDIIVTDDASTNEKLTRLINLIPTYNEKDNIVALATAIFDLYPEASVLVIDDASPDGTARAVKNHQAEFNNLYLLERNDDRGFGKSYRDGFRKILKDCRYDYVVMMDADFSHDPQMVKAMLEQLEEYPIVIGSRYIPGGSIENWQWYRRLFSRLANLYIRSILGIAVKDLTTGFMCFRKDVLSHLDFSKMSSDGYAFLVELKYRLLSLGFDIHEHPIVFAERREGQSKMSYKIIWESILLPWRLKFRAPIPRVSGYFQSGEIESCETSGLSPRP